MDGWKTTCLLGRPIFRGYVSFGEGICVCVNRSKPSIEQKKRPGVHENWTTQVFFSQELTFLLRNMGTYADVMVFSPAQSRQELIRG